jgi:hypothetical protein
LEGKQLSTERKEESGREHHPVVDLNQQMEQPDDEEGSEYDHNDDNQSDSEYLLSDSSTEESLSIEESENLENAEESEVENAHQEDSGSESSSNSEQNPEQEKEIPLLRRSSRNFQPKNWRPGFITFKAAYNIEYDDHRTAAEAMKSPDKHLWKEGNDVISRK